MRNETIREFYYGNMTPAARQIVKGSEMSRVLAELSKIEELLSEAMGEDAAPLLERYEKTQTRISSITAEDSYIDGFKTGARFVMEILDDAHENLEPISE